MIKVLTKEYREGDLAVKTTEVTFLCIPMLRYKKLTTNNQAVKLLTPASKPEKIGGFA